MGLKAMLQSLFQHPKTLFRRMEQIDERSREMKHTLRNLSFKATALHRLVSDMREDKEWTHRAGRPDDKRN